MKRISFAAVAGMQLVLSLVLLLSSAQAEEGTTVVPEVSTAGQVATPRPRDIKSPLSDWREPKAAEPVEGAWSMLRGLGLTLGVFFVGLYVFKRVRGPIQTAQKRKLRILERLPLSSKTALLLVQANGQEVLLSVGSDRVSVIGDMSCGDSCLGCADADFESAIKKGQVEAESSQQKEEA